MSIVFNVVKKIITNKHKIEFFFYSESKIIINPLQLTTKAEYKKFYLENKKKLIRQKTLFYKKMDFI